MEQTQNLNGWRAFDEMGPPGDRRVLIYAYGFIVVGQLDADMWTGTGCPADIYAAGSYWMPLPEPPRL